MIASVAGSNVAIKEATQIQMAKLRRELLGPDPSPLERLLVERVVCCWIAVNGYETRHAQKAGDMTIPQSEYHQRLTDRAHRRFLSSVKSLAQVRRLALPAIQVNIGDKQVNVGG